MIIKKINVKSFGKLKNKEIELKDGLNIIYGENESGKSTLQSFIKVMLYGVDNKRGKKTLSDRSKFTPLGEGSFSGELLVEDNGEEILIDRSFGKTKKYDEGNILNNITGEKINKYSWQEPGKDIFNLSSEGFKNTLFISQMGCTVESSKQDDVLNKIINILECGADEVSYKKIKNNLEENKKSLTNSRKTGKLDLLRIKESELLEERYKRVKIHEENIENELYLKGLKEKRTDLNLKIEELELHKKNLKKSELKNEYENINEYLNKKEKLEEELKALLEELKDVQAICDLKKLNNLRDEFKNYEFLKESLKEKEEKIEKLKESIYEYNEKLKSYGILNEISNNLETKLIELRIEDDRLRENYNVIQKVKEELYQLNEKKDDFLSHLNALKLNDNLVLQIEKDLEKYNNEKIYPSINANLKDEKNIIEEESKSFSRKIFIFRVGEVISILLCAFLFISYFKSENIITLALSILGMLLFIFLLAKSSLNKKEKNNIDIFESNNWIESKKDIKEVIEIRNRLGFKYKYIESWNTPSNISVTELKRAHQEEEFMQESYNIIDNESNEENKKEKIKRKPRFMEERQEEFSAAKKGTITHFVMQHIDLDKVTYIDEIREEVLKMVKKELLTEEEGKVVNVFKIQKFFKSDLGQRMLNSYKSGKKVYRELPFITEIPSSIIEKNLDPKIYGEEKVRLQGIIDAFFEEEDGYVLLDYKTDYVKEGGEEDFINKYKIQINLYKDTLNKILGEEVKEAYLYSFYLERELKISKE